MVSLCVKLTSRPEDGARGKFRLSKVESFYFLRNMNLLMDGLLNRPAGLRAPVSPFKAQKSWQSVRSRNVLISSLILYLFVCYIFVISFLTYHIIS